MGVVFLFGSVFFEWKLSKLLLLAKRFTWSAVGWMVKRHLAVLKPLRVAFDGELGAK